MGIVPLALPTRAACACVTPKWAAKPSEGNSLYVFSLCLQLMHLANQLGGLRGCRAALDSPHSSQGGWVTTIQFWGGSREARAGILNLVGPTSAVILSASSVPCYISRDTQGNVRKGRAGGSFSLLQHKTHGLIQGWICL